LEKKKKKNPSISFQIIVLLFSYGNMTIASHIGRPFCSSYCFSIWNCWSILCVCPIYSIQFINKNFCITN